MNHEDLHSYLFALAGSLLNDNRTLSYRLKGNSMYPTLQAGDTAFVDICPVEQLKKGDIVVFKANNMLIAHRVVEIKSTNQEFYIQTKGDNCLQTDAFFKSDVLLGKINSFTRNGRRISIKSLRMKLLGFFAKKHPHILLKTNGIALALKHQWQNLKSLKNNLSIIAENSGKQLWINALIAILQGILPFVIIVCIKALTDLLIQTDKGNPVQMHYFFILLTITALVFLSNVLLTEIKAYTSEKLSQSVIKHIYKKLHLKHSQLDLSHYENPEDQNRIHRAVQEASYLPLNIINELLVGIKSVAAALFLAGIFISIKWYLIIILIIAIMPDILIRIDYSRKLYKLKNQHSEPEREMYYYNRVLTGYPFAKEQKLFGFADFFLTRFTKIQGQLFKDKIQLSKTQLKREILVQIFAIALIFFALAYVSLLKINGHISIGTVVLFFFAFQRGYAVLNDLFRSSTQIIEDNSFLNDFISFINIASKKDTTAHRSFSLQKKISIEHLIFRYKNSKRNALNDINLVIPAGKTVAFVGENGSGKTTLIKLLCGFYSPDSGDIFFDGIPAENIGGKIIRENISAVFQDFALYNISALLNIGLGDTKTPIDTNKAKKAAEAADIAETMEKLPEGYNTLLGNLFTGGEELSIGQWQKIAIARAFYRNAPLLLMDEPSSALDAHAELDIIEKLKKLSENKTAVIVSHRLTTVQWADLIYVFDQGKIIESGTHQELISKNGKYQSLFTAANKKS